MNGMHLEYYINANFYYHLIFCGVLHKHLLHNVDEMCVLKCVRMVCVCVSCVCL